MTAPQRTSPRKIPDVPSIQRPALLAKLKDYHQSLTPCVPVSKQLPLVIDAIVRDVSVALPSLTREQIIHELSTQVQLFTYYCQWNNRLKKARAEQKARSEQKDQIPSMTEGDSSSGDSMTADQPVSKQLPVVIQPAQAEPEDQAESRAVNVEGLSCCRCLLRM